MIHFILGGARSGKSRFAEQQTLLIANEKQKQAMYIATGTPIDAEMKQRIAKHQLDRDESWKLVECPLKLVQQIDVSNESEVYLVDCLTLWLNNVLYSLESLPVLKREEQIKVQIAELIQALQKSNANIIIVSNEVGLGIIPMGEQTRLFVDYCGWLNQQVAAIADNVTLITAGLPLSLKKTELYS